MAQGKAQEQVKELFEHRSFKFPKKDGVKIESRGRQAMQPPTEAQNIPPRPDPRKPAVRVEAIEDMPKAQPQPTPRNIQVEKNPAFVDITLPSNFVFYPFKSLAVRTFKAQDQAKCIRAAKEGRFRHLVEAISGTLQSDVSAHDLTHQDFYFVMYWHRTNSFGKSPYIHKALCENEQHLQDVIEGRKKEETLEISTIITRSTLSEKQLDPSTIYYPEELMQKYQLGVLKIRDMVEIDEMEDDPSFGDIEFLADLATYLEPRSVEEMTVRSRIEIVKEMSTDEVEELQNYIKSVNDYGVSESINIKCKECGAEREAKVSIDALSFLPTSR